MFGKNFVKIPGVHAPSAGGDPPKTDIRMESISTVANEVFDRCVADYHLADDVDATVSNPYPKGSFEAILYSKNWVDAVQWHLRTDMVEDIDTWMRDRYKGVTALVDATINTESPAWALDRLSILALKIWHMREQTERTDADADHLARCEAKLDVLLEQRQDLSLAIDQLLADIAAGRKYMKVYRQMKMYNDPATNPVLYAKRQ